MNKVDTEKLKKRTLDSSIPKAKRIKFDEDDSESDNSIDVDGKFWILNIFNGGES